MLITEAWVSVVPIDDTLVRNVAERCGTDETHVKRYLSSDQQDDMLLRAFLFFGVGPLGKVFEVEGRRVRWLRSGM